jgi:hypothetical protein
MKNQLTPIQYPTTMDETFRWGFDIHPPKGVPRAWVTDWDAVGPGFNVSEDQSAKVLALTPGSRFGDISIDDVTAAQSLFTKRFLHTTFKLIAEVCGTEESLEIARLMGDALGTRTWDLAQAKFGKEVSLPMTAFHQDVAHLLSGCGNSAYAWVDDEKMVCSRTNCFMRAPDGFTGTASYCRSFDDAHIIAYMAVERDLLIVPIGCCCSLGTEHLENGQVSLTDRVQDPIPHDNPKAPGRAIHMWTYSKDVVNDLSDDVKDHVSESIKEALRAKGCKI